MLITSYTPRPELLDLPGAPETVSQHSTQELFYTICSGYEEHTTRRRIQVAVQRPPYHLCTVGF